MTNSEQVAYQQMLRESEARMFGDDDAETAHTWIDAKRESPIAAQMCWVAVPNAITAVIKHYFVTWTRTINGVMRQVF